MKDKILTLLGFATKAGKLSFGTSKALESVEKGKAKLVLCASNISPKTQKELNFHCNKKFVKVISLTDIDTEMLSSAVGRNCGVVSVNDNGFADSIISIGGLAYDK